MGPSVLCLGFPPCSFWLLAAGSLCLRHIASTCAYTHRPIHSKPVLKTTLKMNLRRGRHSVTCFILFSFRPGKKRVLAANQRGGGSLLAETKSSLPVSWDSGSGLKQLRDAPPDHGCSISWTFSCQPGFPFHGTLDPFPLLSQLSQPMFHTAKRDLGVRG